MFFFFSKLLTFLINPLVWMLALLCLALFLKNSIWKKRSLIAAITFFLFFSNPLIINKVANLWEPPPLAISDFDAPYDIGIVLSGYGKSRYHLPNASQLFYFSSAANRLTLSLIHI